MTNSYLHNSEETSIRLIIRINHIIKTLIKKGKYPAAWISDAHTTTTAFSDRLNPLASDAQKMQNYIN